MASSDLMLFFSGVQGKGDAADRAEGGKPVGENEQGMFEEMKKIAPRSGHPRIERGWYGSIVSIEKVVEEAFQFVITCQQYLPPESKLIIYGYSAGGYDALSLCRRFDEYNSYDRRSQEALVRHYNPAVTNPVAKIVVDLLVTIDAAARKLTPLVNRKVADCVVRNVNHYQYAFFGELLGRSEGGPNSGKGTILNTNHGYTGARHGKMQEATMPDALKEMKGCLGVD